MFSFHNRDLIVRPDGTSSFQLKSTNGWRYDTGTGQVSRLVSSVGGCNTFWDPQSGFTREFDCGYGRLDEHGNFIGYVDRRGW